MTIKTTTSLMLALILVAIVTPALAESGIASIYGNGDGYAGKCVAEQKPTGGCKRMNPRALSAAHRTLPFGSHVTVTNRKNGRTTTVRIDNRGPFVRGRIIDLSPAAAAALGCDGLCPVTVQ